jgi:hypothetical protein
VEKYKKITLRNAKTGQMKNAPVGFSWTTFFFGFFVPMCREDWKWAGIQFVATIFFGGCCSLFMSFMYNKLYIRDLVAVGFVPEDENQCTFIIDKGIVTEKELDNAKMM